ncbi:MAG: hypothetical protein ACRERR_12625 [Moraxellaceae bacterium]
MSQPALMTHSEKTLVKIFKNRGLSPIKIPESEFNNEKRPDFEVLIGELITIWEVKEITENPSEKEIELGNLPDQTYSVESSKRIEKHIDKARKQFISYSANDKPCIIAIMDKRGFFTKDLLLPDEIMLTLAGRGHFMEGSSGQLLEIHRDKSRISEYGFISAIAILYQEKEEIVFIHNPHAKFPLNTSDFSLIFKKNYRPRLTDKGLQWESDHT